MFCFICQCLSGFNLPNQYDNVKLFNDGQNKKKEKKKHKQEKGALAPKISYLFGQIPVFNHYY